MIPPDPTAWTGALGAWLFLGLRILAAMGFAATANLVMLYAS